MIWAKNKENKKNFELKIIIYTTFEIAAYLIGMFAKN